MTGLRQGLLRPSAGDEAHRVTYTELFFDLVFVFAITQVSHILIHEQSATALLHAFVLALMVWWVWVYTTWAGNWLNPERGPVRGLFIALMLFGLLVSAAIPDAFGDKALLFAVSMTALQLSRSVFTVVAFAPTQPDHAINFVRISIWHAVCGVIWIAGALCAPDARLLLWLIALVVEFAGPRARYWVPGLGRSPVESWNVTGEHMSERVSLFLIIALGESIVVTGAGFSETPLNLTSGVAFLAAFAGCVLMWLLYFNHNQRGGSDYLIKARVRGMIAQTAYTYVPVLLVLGIVFTAVADGLVLRDPTGPTTLWTSGLLCGASAAYLLGNALFRRATGGPWLLSHLIGVVACVALFGVHPALSPLALSWLVNLVLAVVVVADDVAVRRQQAATSEA
jgi:low temperature requirement protein LtrA